MLDLLLDFAGPVLHPGAADEGVRVEGLVVEGFVGVLVHGEREFGPNSSGLR